MPTVTDRLKALLAEEIVLLDGSWGVLIQREVRGEEAYRGERFRDHPRDVAGDPDLLNLTKPDTVLDIHRAYFAAGARIATTNTFTATSIGQADYALEPWVAEMNVAGARLARQAADEVGGFVAGSVGPLNVTLSLSPKVDDAAYRAVTFDEVCAAYAEQMTALVEGGVDLFLIETVFDTLNAKAAIAAALDVAPEVPRWICFTAIDASGRNLSGQTVEAFWRSVEHAEPLIVGVNCSLGATEMRPYVEGLSAVASTYVSCHPNAGLPNELGLHDEQPGDTSRYLREFAEDGLVNVVGGCCGTTPEHVQAIAAAIRGLAPRRIPELERQTVFSGLEPFAIEPDTGFVLVGERTNVTGSARFRRLIEGDDFQEALDVALDQVRGGANLIDVNMDADLLDSEAAMTRFLNLVATEPEVSVLPIMVDSSRFSVLEAGLKCVQGKGVANSLSLKEGEEPFLDQARRVRRLGAAALVMAFDEQGQAETVERKVEVCERAYGLLIERAGFAPQDIIFDPNILAVGTGIEEHAEFAKAFIDATRLIKERCPGARVSGGISNLSFAFRGADHVREAIHSAFLFHAIQAGLDMGIVNAGQLAVYEDIGPELLELVEDLIFNRRPDATERLLEYAQRVEGDATKREVDLSWREEPVEKRLEHALVHGIVDYIEDDVEEARQNARPPARRDRGAADGRHAGGRRPLRLGPYVPAAGREERARDEAGRGLSRALHGCGARRDGGEPLARHGRARDGEGRRPRHRQEHRRRRARLQQLRRRRPRRDGAGRQGARDGERGRRGHRRAVRADHAVARRDGARGARDGAPRRDPAAPDRRRDDVEAPHGGAHRARVLVARPCTCSTHRASSRSSPRCSTRSAVPHSSGRTSRSRTPFASSTRRGEGRASCRSPRRASTVTRSRSTSFRRRRSRARATSRPISRRSRATSTGRSSSTPGA